jgi:hypothetical protein
MHPHTKPDILQSSSVHDWWKRETVEDDVMLLQVPSITQNQTMLPFDQWTSMGTVTIQGAGVMQLQVDDDSQLLVTDLEYADDAALCASNPQQLQNLINSFVAYCDKHGLTMNPSKVVFAKSCRAWSGFVDWKVKGKGKALPRSRTVQVSRCRATRCHWHQGLS